MKKLFTILVLLLAVSGAALSSTPCLDADHICEQCWEMCDSRYDFCVRHRASTGLPLTCEITYTNCIDSCG